MSDRTPKKTDTSHTTPHGMWAWFEAQMQTRYAERWLAVYSFFEAVILPFPTDIFLALMVFANRARAVWLTILTTLSSLAGAIVLFFITVFFNEVILQSLIQSAGLEESVVQASAAIQGVAFVAIFLAAFTPIPYTPAIIAAALLNVNFGVFVLASIAGRGIRYSVVSLFVYFFGIALLPRLKRVSTVATAVVVSVLALVWFVFIA